MGLQHCVCDFNSPFYTLLIFVPGPEQSHPSMPPQPLGWETVFNSYTLKSSETAWRREVWTRGAEDNGKLGKRPMDGVGDKF